MKRSVIIRFALGFALLIVLAVCAVAGAVALGLQSGKASKHSVEVIEQKLNPGALQAYKDACEAQVRGAANDGITLVECKLTDPKSIALKHNPDVKGDHAMVALTVKSSEGQAYVVFVELDKTAWTMTNYKVTPLAKGLPTIEAPR